MGGPQTSDAAAPVRPGSPAPPWATALWWLASLLAALLHNGLWATPNLGFVALIARSPGENPFGDSLAGDYLLTNVSLTRLAGLLGQTELHEVARLHLVVLVVGWGLVVLLARMRHGHGTARTLTVVLAASPLVTVSMQWLGQPDPLTGLCGVAMVLVPRRWAVFAIGALAGITHPEQAVIMAGVAGTVRCFLPPPGGTGEQVGRRGYRSLLESVAAAVGGAALGWLAVQLWFLVSDITLSTPRSDYLDYGLDSFWQHHSTHPIGLLWTLWGPLWLVLAAVGAAVALSDRLGRAGRTPSAATPRKVPGAGTAGIVMAALAALALLPVFVTLDETRVYAVLTAPLLAAAALWLAALWPGTALRWPAAALLVVTAALPGGFATGTTSWRSQLDTLEMVEFLEDGSIDGSDPEETAVTPWLLGPFDIEIPDPPR